jgi:hypothetical protein
VKARRVNAKQWLRYNSTKAAEATGETRGKIRTFLSGNAPHLNGWVFKYAERSESEESEDIDEHQDCDSLQTMAGESSSQKRKRFTAEEDVQLKTMVQEEGPSSWTSKSQRFDTDRAGPSLRQRWFKALDSTSQPTEHFYTAAEDTELTIMVKQEGPSHWPSKAERFSTDRTGSSLRLRWIRITAGDHSDHEMDEQEGGDEKSEEKQIDEVVVVAAQPRTSRFIGVSWATNGSGTQGKWQARIQHDGHRENLGSFEEDKEEDAARTFDAASRRLRGAQAHGGGSLGRQWCLNFPTDEEITSAAQTCAANKDKEDKKEEERQAEKEDQRAAAARKLVGARTSRFLGVAWTKRTGKWHARIQHNGSRESLGYFVEQEDAARAFDAASRRLRGAQAHGGGSGNYKTWLLNFPTDIEAQNHNNIDEEDDASNASNAHTPVCTSLKYTEAEDAQLIRMVQEEGDGHWESKAGRFDTARSADSLRKRWSFTIKARQADAVALEGRRRKCEPMRYGVYKSNEVATIASDSAYTQAEDAQLTQMVDDEGSAYNDWGSKAARFDTERSAEMLDARWCSILNRRQHEQSRLQGLGAEQKQDLQQQQQPAQEPKQPSEQQPQQQPQRHRGYSQPVRARRVNSSQWVQYSSARRAAEATRQTRELIRKFLRGDKPHDSAWVFEYAETHESAEDDAIQHLGSLQPKEDRKEDQDDVQHEAADEHETVADARGSAVEASADDEMDEQEEQEEQEDDGVGDKAAGEVENRSLPRKRSAPARWSDDPHATADLAGGDAEKYRRLHTESPNAATQRKENVAAQRPNSPEPWRADDESEGQKEDLPQLLRGASTRRPQERTPEWKQRQDGRGLATEAGMYL